MISFVIPAYNEEKLLPKTLAALHSSGRLVGEDYEIVVADDASSDGTAGVAEAQGARVLRVSHRQISATRNSGAREAKGDLLVFVDADTIVPWQTVAAALGATRAGAVGGGAKVAFDGEIPLYGRILLPIVQKLFGVARLASGCFIFCTRAGFDSIGGFDERLFGAEEIAFSRALGRRGRFVILNEVVTTSGRKLRDHSGWHIVKSMLGLALRGPGAVRRREGMDLWYRERTDDQDGASLRDHEL